MAGGAEQFEAWGTVPSLAVLTPSLAGGRWAAVEDHLVTLGPESQALALAYLGGLDTVESLDDVLGRAADTGSPIARTALAHRCVHLGWQARSQLRAEHVSPEQFEQFHLWLNRAEQVLVAVCAEHPAYAPAWALRQHTARGLELGRSEARRRLDRLRAVCAPHWPGERAYLQITCPKWGGSWEVADAFVRETTGQVPAGAASHALVAELHVERWIDVEPAEGHEYLAQPAVLAELRAAADRSVWHPAWRPGLLDVEVHSVFALAFSLGGALVDAGRHFRALDGRLADSWRYVTHLGRPLDAYRAEALDAFSRAVAA